MQVNGVCDIASLIRRNCRLSSRDFRITCTVVTVARLTSCLWDRADRCENLQFVIPASLTVTSGDKRLGPLVLGPARTRPAQAWIVDAGDVDVDCDRDGRYGRNSFNTSVADNDLSNRGLDCFHGGVGRRQLCRRQLDRVGRCLGVGAH